MQNSIVWNKKIKHNYNQIKGKSDCGLRVSVKNKFRRALFNRFDKKITTSTCEVV